MNDDDHNLAVISVSCIIFFSNQCIMQKSPHILDVIGRFHLISLSSTCHCRISYAIIRNNISYHQVTNNITSSSCDGEFAMQQVVRVQSIKSLRRADFDKIIIDASILFDLFQDIIYNNH